MLLDWIEEARKKPDHIRTRYALIIAISITSIIVVIWFFSLPAQFSETSEIEETDEFNNLKSLWTDFKDLFSFEGIEVVNDLQDDSATSTAIEPETNMVEDAIRATTVGSEEDADTLDNPNPSTEQQKPIIIETVSE